jgi:hypothetical protein
MGAPALLALTSAPVLAANCKLPSGFSASGNLSRTGSKNCSEAAPTPTVWSSMTTGNNGNNGNNNLKYTGTNIKTTDTFIGAGFNVKYFAVGDSFATVLARGNLDIVALTASAFLTALAGGNSTTFPDSVKIARMWNDGVAGTIGYTATTGVVWHETEVRNYLLYLTGQA